MTLKNTLALIVLLLASASVNSQQSPTWKLNQFIFGQTFDEVTVSSDLKVNRISKENRQGKVLSANENLQTKSLPNESSSLSSSSSSSSRILLAESRPERRKKRSNQPTLSNYDDNYKWFVNKRKERKYKREEELKTKEVVNKKQKLMFDKIKKVKSKNDDKNVKKLVV